MPLPPTHRLRLLARDILVVTLVVILAAMGVLTSNGAARADDTIGISGVPADDEGNADGRSRFSYTADPGQQIGDNYLVRNTGSTAQSFTILATDAFNDDEGNFGLLQTGVEPVHAGAWVAFENGTNSLRFDLAPGESRLVPFLLNIPADATPGDHAGGILASVVTPGEQVTVDRRLGTRLYLRVAGDLQPGLSISGLNASYVGDWWNPVSGSVRLHYTVENRGNVALAANITVGTRAWFGVPVGGEQGDAIPELLPGATRTFETDIPGIASLGYLNPWVSLSPFVEGNDDSKRVGVDPIERDTLLIALPWILLLALVLVLVVFVLLRWRRRVDARRAARWIAWTEAEAKRKAEGDREVVGAGGSGYRR